MEESLITFKTNKLAKEKGFNIEQVIIHSYNKGLEESLIKGVSQSLLQKWLREVHSIHIEILLGDDKPYNTFYYRIMKIGKYFPLSHDGIYNESYNETLELALQKSLLLIIIPEIT